LFFKGIVQVVVFASKPIPCVAEEVRWNKERAEPDVPPNVDPLVFKRVIKTPLIHRENEMPERTASKSKMTVAKKW